MGIWACLGFEITDIMIVIGVEDLYQKSDANFKICLHRLPLTSKLD